MVVRPKHRDVKMRKVLTAAAAGVLALSLSSCVSGKPEIIVETPTATPTPTPTPEAVMPDKPNLSAIEKGVDEVHILTGGKYGSGSTYDDVAELLQVICWTLDDARSVDDAMDIVFDAGDDSGVSTKHSAAFIYSATKHVCPEWYVAVQEWSNS